MSTLLRAPAATELQSAETVRIMGAPISALSEAEAVREIVRAAVERRGSWTITANLDHLRRYWHEPLARSLIDGADLVLADGTPLVWASRVAGTRLPERVAGSNMVWSISEAASASKTPVFLLGGNPGVAERAASVLADRYDGLAVAGTLCPPPGFEEDLRELSRIAREVARCAPAIVFVALGFPKQDVLIARLRKLLPAASFIGVGISLSFVSGEMTRAPAWTQRAGLEWLIRLRREPRRLARRYLLLGLPFALRLLASAARHRLGHGNRPGLWGRVSAGHGLDLPGTPAARIAWRAALRLGRQQPGPQASSDRGSAGG